MPYRTFASGEVLTASNVMTYLANQSVVSVTNAAGRPTSPATGMLVYVQDVAQLQLWNGSAWVQVFPVVSDGITNGTIGTNDLADGLITTAKIADGAVLTQDIADGAVTNAKLVNNGTYSINVTGNAGTASNATLVGGYGPDLAANGYTLVLRDYFGGVETGEIINRASTGAFHVASTASYWLASNYTFSKTLFRVDAGTGVYGTSVSSARTVGVNSAGTLGYISSSERHKEDINPLDVDVDKVLGIEPVTYRYKREAVEEGSDRPVEIGVIAEQVAEQGFDEIVYRDVDGRIDGVAYERLAVLLLGVCKAQQAQIDDLTARVEALEAK